MALLDELKNKNPHERYWVKLDATDCVEALMDSQSGEWNGDVNLGNGGNGLFKVSLVSVT